eukprot:s2181_g4.t1
MVMEWQHQNRKLARLSELQRLLTRPNGWEDQNVAVHALAARLGFSSTQGLLPVLRREILVAKDELPKTEQERKNLTIQQWRANLIQDPKAMGRWLRARGGPSISQVQGLGRSCSHPKQVAGLIKDFWNDFWSHNDLDHDTISQNLIRSAVVSDQSNWTRPSVDDLMSVVRKHVLFEGDQRSQWALPDFNRELQIPVGTAGFQPRAPDPSGHCRTLTPSSRSQWALPDFNRELQIAVGTAGLQPRAPDPSGHCRASVATARSQWALLDFNRQIECQREFKKERRKNAKENAKKNVR